MNIVESHTIANPYGKSDECAKFTIDDATSVFTLADVTSVGQLYTFSAWVRGEVSGTFSILDQEFPVTTEWRQCTATFTATSEDVTISFGLTGIYYIYSSQLEIGNQVTDWTPSLEDVEEDMENVVQESNVSQRTDILAECDRLVLSAKETIMTDVRGEYVNQSEYESKMAELALQADSIEMRFQTAESSINDGKTKFEEFYKHISFSDDGITITAGENAMSLRLDNDEIVFYKGDVEFGRWNGVDFYTGNIYIAVNERAQFGNFAYVPRSDGSLSFYKVGG